MREWLPENHLAHFILDLADTLGLDAILSVYRAKSDRGRAAYHPKMMVSLLIYAYCMGKHRAPGSPPNSSRLEGSGGWGCAQEAVSNKQKSATSAMLHRRKHPNLNDTLRYSSGMPSCAYGTLAQLRTETGVRWHKGCDPAD
jgi:hypothetical protein